MGRIMYKYFHTAIIMLALSACGSNGSDGGDASPSPTPSPSPTADILDCLDLSPDRVYLLGTLQEDEPVYALTDPLDPNVFCIGFPDDHLHQATVSDLNHLVYAYDSFSDKNIYVMRPEELTKDIDNRWDYPSFTTDNDTILLTSDLEGCGFSAIKVASESENVFYSCPNDTINTEVRTPHYDLGTTADNALLSVLNDGTMLVSKFGNGNKDLIIVDPDLNETTLELPIPDADTIFGAVKQYISPVTGNQSIWVQVIYHEDSIYLNNKDAIVIRLSIDLNTLEIVNDGVFAPFPSGTEFRVFEGVFDGNGNLWQQGRSVSDVGDDMLIRRPLAASGSASEIIYRESDYRDREVYVGSEQLCEDASFEDVQSGNCVGGDYGWRHHENLFVKMDWLSQLVTGN